MLDEQVHLAPDAEHRSFLHSSQFLLQSHQDALRYFVETLVSVTKDKHTGCGEVRQVKGLGDRKDSRPSLVRDGSPEIAFAFLVLSRGRGLQLSVVLRPLL